MNIVVPVKIVPDLVEELFVDDSGTALDTTYLRMRLNESDDHAIEQAVLLKERYGGQVTVLAPDMESAEDALFTAAAKGADRLIKLTGDFDESANSGHQLNNHALARQIATIIKEIQPDLVMTGVGAHNDLDGAIGPLLAEMLDLPYVGYVAGVGFDEMNVTLRKEFPGGLIAEMQVTLPAVLGIQAAEQPPRYVAFSKVRQAMKSVPVEEVSLEAFDPRGGPLVERLFLPEKGEQATMIEGDVDEIADRLVVIIRELGLA
jgi:electron transfer flavoprotein beta subunit